MGYLPLNNYITLHFHSRVPHNIERRGASEKKKVSILLAQEVGGEIKMNE
jgi:hypothetical protein